METLFWQSADFLMCAVETALLFILCERFLVRDRERGTHEVLIACAAITCLSFGASMITSYATWKTLLSIVSIFCFCSFSYQGTAKQKLLCTVLYFSIIVFSDLIAGSGITLFLHASYIDVWEQEDAGKIVMFSISKIISIVSITFLSNFTYKKDNMPRNILNAFVLIFSAVLVSILMTADILLISTENRQIRLVFMGLVLAILVFYLFFYFCLYYLSNYFSIQNESNMLFQERQMIEKYLTQKINADQEIKILSHDMKNVLIGWRDLSERGENDALTQGIERYLDSLKSSTLIDFNNTTANALINQKILLAKNLDIDLVVTGVFHEGLTLNQVDLCALLGNILDNALEATQKLSEPEKRKIRMRIGRKEEYLLISSNNPYADLPKKKAGGFMSTKKDSAYHGLGLVSIRKIIEQNQGTMELTTENNVFLLQAMLLVYPRG